MARTIRNTYAVRLTVEDGGKVKAELFDVGKSGEQALDKIKQGGKGAGEGLGALTDRAKSLSKNLKVMAVAATAAAAIGGLAVLTKNAVESAAALNDAATKIGINVEALQELRFAADQAGVSQESFDKSLEGFTRRIGDAARGTGSATKAFEDLGISILDSEGDIRRTEDIFNDVADAMAGIEDPAARASRAVALFGKDGAALAGVLANGSKEIETMRQRARDLGIVLEEDLIKNAGRADSELKVLSQVVSANLNRALLDLSPLIADAAGGLSDLASDAGSAYEKLKLIFQGDFSLEGRSLRVLNHDLADLKEQLADIDADIERRKSLRSDSFFSNALHGTTSIDFAGLDQRRADALEKIADTEKRINDIRAQRKDTDGDTGARGPTQAEIQALLDKQQELQQLVTTLDKQLFDLTHEGAKRIEAEYQQQIGLIKSVAGPDEIDSLLAKALEVKTIRLKQLTDQESEAEERRIALAQKSATAEEERRQKAIQANQAVADSLQLEIAALNKSERQNFIDQAVRRLSAQATEAQRIEVERLAGSLFDEQEAMEARRKEQERQTALIKDIKSLTDEQTAAQQKYNDEMAELNRLLKEGAINQKDFEAASKRARDSMLQHSKEWTAGVQRALQSYADEATDLAGQIEQVTTTMIQGLEDAIVEFTTTGKVNWKDMVNSMISDITRLIVRTQITGPLAGALNQAIGGLFASANGNVFDGGMPVTAFARGGVVNSPTIFPMADGMGLMGEAGPEAVMPLRRLPNGKLGVESTGAANSYTVNVDARGSDDPATTARKVETAVDRALTARMPGIIRTSVSAARSDVVDMWQRRGGRID